MTDRDTPAPRPEGAVPQLPLAAVERAERRSRAAGPWSVEHLRLCWAVLGTVGFVFTSIVGAAGAGRDALGVAVGTLIVGAFFTLSTLVIAWVGARMPEMVLPAALGTYLLKIVMLGGVIILLPSDGPIAPRWMAIAVVVGLIAWLGAHLRWISTAKIFYVDPG